MRRVHEVVVASTLLCGAVAGCSSETQPQGIETTVLQDGLPVRESPSDYSQESWRLEEGETAYVTCWDTDNYIGVQVGQINGFIQPFVRVDGVAQNTIDVTLPEIRAAVGLCE